MKQNLLKEQILKVLEKKPHTRDSDIALTIEVWQTFYSVGRSVSLRRLFELPSQDSIKRIRAIIQNVQHHFIPTQWSVAKKRHWASAVWRQWLKSEVNSW